MANLRDEINFTLDMFNVVSGIPVPTPRYPVPSPPVFQRIEQNAPVSLFKIDRSVVGSVNTGTIESLEVSIRDVQQGGNEQLAKQLEEFTQAVLDEKSLTDEARGELLDQLEVVSAAARDPAAAKKSVIRPILSAIALGAGTVEKLAAAWAKVEPYLRGLFT